MSTFKFDPKAFNYEKAVQNSEASLEKSNWIFAPKMQTLCHIVPISSNKIGFNVWQYTAKPLSDKLFSRTVLCMKATEEFNSFLMEKMDELGYEHGKVNENGVTEYHRCPIKELVDKTGLEDQMPEFNGKKGKIIPKETTYYIIVPYATRAIPSDKVKNPPWTPVNVVQPYWVIGKDGKNVSQHLRPIIEKIFAQSKGQAANLSGTTYMAINRLGDGNDTVYSGEVVTDPTGLERPSTKQVLEIVSEKFDSLNPATSLAFMMPSRSELESLASKSGVVLTSLFPVAKSLADEGTTDSTTDSSDEAETSEQLLDL
jgi:hypothetical protein